MAGKERAIPARFALLRRVWDNASRIRSAFSIPRSETDPMSRLTAILLTVLAAGTSLLLVRAQEPDAPFGLERRIPWTTSGVVGSPEPPLPYRTERVFPRLRFDRSLDLAGAPGGKRWFIGE